MENENITKYIPLVVSGIALLIGMSNKKNINFLENKCSKGFKEVADVLTGVDSSLNSCNENFKIIQRDINKIGHFVGYKGRLGVND